jgi:hypothetical protein
MLSRSLIHNRFFCAFEKKKKKKKKKIFLKNKKKCRSFANKTTPLSPLEPSTSLESAYGNFERRLKQFRSHHKKPLTLAEKGEKKKKKKKKKKKTSLKISKTQSNLFQFQSFMVIWMIQTPKSFVAKRT